MWDTWEIRPLIDTRHLWRDEKKEPGYDPYVPITRSLHPDRVDTIVHTGKGEVSCICPVTQTQRPLAFQGFEKDRGTLKYRCPAAAWGIICEGREVCESDAGCRTQGHGRVVRVSLETDRRIFTPTPHGSPSWKRGYRARSALERINSRLDRVYGFEEHVIRGLARMTLQVNLVLVVMMALALASVREKRPELMRSLVGAIPGAG